MTSHARSLFWLAVPAALLLGACAAPPMGPTVQVLPSPSKPFQAFQRDPYECGQYAHSMVAGQAEFANQRAVGGTAAGVLLGGLLGAAIGNGRGAGIGAASGAIVGTSASAPGTAYAQGSIQHQYNNAYVQCMYARGNQVPGVAGWGPRGHEHAHPQPYQQPYPPPYQGPQQPYAPYPPYPVRPPYTP